MMPGVANDWGIVHVSGQITIIPKPELRGFWGGCRYFSPPFGVTSAVRSL